ncbi:glycosyltransferase [Mucilaginibacter xinganensis]|uniref:glycosyltransferase n=1 Tax=Mucilaginibacter xinganensis TaxID=1234841 RepID=UPI000B98C550|nr:glycosyltransferase [Mucilaginibacter xinganensis]
MKSNSNLKQSKVFFIIPTLNGGGAERVLISIANYFVQLKCTPVIIALNQCEPAYVINPAVKVIFLVRRQGKRSLRLYYIFQTSFKLMALILRQKPVCVLSFITSANLWAGITCTITNTPFIVSERTTPDRTINQFSYLLKLITALLYKKAKAVVVSAKGVEDCLRKNELFKDITNVYRIPNAVPEFDNPSTRLVHSRPFILGVGRLSYVKGFDQLITAFSNAQLDGVDLLIVGDGEEKSNLICQIYNLGLRDRVKLLGAKTNLQDYYSQAEIFVLPSRNEGYPNALVEAMSFGCPCIAMNCEFGPSEIIKNKKNGILLPNGSIDALSNTLKQLIADPLLKDNLSREAIKINKTNNADQLLGKWERLILSRLT